MIRNCISALLLTASASSYAATAIDGLYASVYGGWAYVPDNINSFYGGLHRTDATYQDAFMAGGAFGYKSNPMRYEGELFYVGSDLKGFRINNTKQTTPFGDSNGVFALASAYYDFCEVIPTITPFLGVGLGYGWVDTQMNAEGPNFRSRFNSKGSIFAYQASAGLSYNFAENFSLYVNYRYLGGGELKNMGENYQAHIAMGGVTYRFDGGLYK